MNKGEEEAHFSCQKTKSIHSVCLKQEEEEFGMSWCKKTASTV